MPTKIKIRALKVRPKRSSDLSFPTSGTIETRNLDKAVLGADISGYDIRAELYTLLEADSANVPISLEYNSNKIRGALCRDDQNRFYPHFLFALKNDNLAATLDQAILARSKAFFERYQHKELIAERLASLYLKTDWDVQPDDLSESRPISKVGIAKAIKRVSDKHFTTIKEAYNQDATPEVVKTSETKSTPEGTIVSETKSHGGVRSSFTEEAIFKDAAGNPTQKMDPANQDNVPLAFDKAQSTWVPTVELAKDPNDNNQFNPNLVPVTNRVITKHLGPGVPPAENPSTANPFRNTATTYHRIYFNPKRAHAKTYLQEKLDILDNEFAHEIFGARVDKIREIIDIERNIQDLDIRQLQLSFSALFLTPPISGRVTNVYKDVGETVRAGEPVIRIEDDSNLLLVGWIQCRGPLSVGSMIKISTDVFETGGAQLEIQSRVVSVRGHDADNDEWDVILECANPTSAGKRILPLNYTFDYKSTMAELL